MPYLYSEDLDIFAITSYNVEFNASSLTDLIVLSTYSGNIIPFLSISIISNAYLKVFNYSYVNTYFSAILFLRG